MGFTIYLSHHGFYFQSQYSTMTMLSYVIFAQIIGHSFGYIFWGICPNIINLLASGPPAPGRLTNSQATCGTESRKRQVKISVKMKNEN